MSRVRELEHRRDELRAQLGEVRVELHQVDTELDALGRETTLTGLLIELVREHPDATMAALADLLPGWDRGTISTTLWRLVKEDVLTVDKTGSPHEYRVKK